MVIDGEEGLCSNSLIFRASPSFASSVIIGILPRHATRHALLLGHSDQSAATRDATRNAAGPFPPLDQSASSIPFFLSSSAFGYVVGILFGATALCGRFLISLWDYCISNGRHSSCFSALCGRLEFRRNYSTCFHPTLCGRLEYRKDLFYIIGIYDNEGIYSTCLHPALCGFYDGFILQACIPPCAVD